MPPDALTVLVAERVHSDILKHCGYHYGFLKQETLFSGYVRKHYDVKNRAFLQNLMRDFGHFYAQFVLVNYSKFIRCKNRAFRMKNMRVFF